MLPPGPRTPALWNLTRLVRAPIETLTAWQAQFGDVFTVSFTGFGQGVYVADPDAIRGLFTGDQSDLLAGDANSVLAPIVGSRSVLVLDGPDHLSRRRLLLPPFQGSRVAAFREVARSVAAREVAGWEVGSEVVLRDRMRAVTFEVICRAVFGVTEPARVERLRVALAAVIDTAPAMLLIEALRRDLGPWSPGGRFARRLRAADALLLEEIGLRRRVADLEGRSDVLSLLLQARFEDGEPMSDRELRDQLLTMLSAGHETTATALAFAVELLLRNPDVLARVRAGDDALLDATVQETLRLRPIIDAAQRTLTRPREVAGWVLPPGVRVYPAPLLVHLREDLFPGAREFRPERFLEGASSYSWLPFGGGIRRCLGAALAQAEMAEVLRVLLGSVDLVPVRPVADPVVLRGVTLAPRYGVPVRVVGRRAAVRSPRAAAAVAALH